MTPLEVIAAMDAAAALLGFIDRAIAAGKERGEWTPEQESEFAIKRQTIMQQAHWQIKPPVS